MLSAVDVVSARLISEPGQHAKHAVGARRCGRERERGGERERERDESAVSPATVVPVAPTELFGTVSFYVATLSFDVLMSCVTRRIVSLCFPVESLALTISCQGDPSTCHNKDS